MGQKNKEELLLAEWQLLFLHSLEYHVRTLLYLPLDNTSWTIEERDMIIHAVTELVHNLQHSQDYNSQNHQLQLKNITDLFWDHHGETAKDHEILSTSFPPELIILYELVTIYNVVDQFYDPHYIAEDEQ